MAIRYAYDPATGRKTRTWTASNDTVYGYDERGRLKSVTVAKLNGQTPAQPVLPQKPWDAAGHESSTVSIYPVTIYGYDEVGNLKTVTQPNGVVTSYDYDDLSRMKSETVTQSGSVIATYGNTYRSDGAKTQVVEHLKQPGGGGVFSDRKVTWEYDGLSRLLSETVDEGNNGPDGSDFKDSYTYDLTANRLSKTHDAGNDGTIQETITYGFGANQNDQLQSETSTLTGVTTYGYDANGSLTTKSSSAGTVNYGFDLRNRMVGVDVNGNGVYTDAGDLRYTYDSSGNRVGQEVVGTKVTRNVIDAQSLTGYPQTIEEWATAGASTTSISYVFGHTILTQTDASGNVIHLVTDPHGNTRQVTGATGSILAQYNYDPFGNARGFDADAALTKHLAADGAWDAGTDMTEMGARDLMGNGRWSTADPTTFGVGDISDWNRYVFVGGNPNLRDPSGLFGIVELGMNMFTIMQQYGSRALAAYNVYDKANTIYDAAALVAKFMFTGTIDPIAAAIMLTQFLPFGKLLKTKIVGNFLTGAEKTLGGVYKNAKGLMPGNLQKVSELVGEVGTGLVAKAHGWLPTTFPRKYHGIESVLDDGLGNLVILEAKGGAADLSKRQMSQTWIMERIEKLRISDSPLEKEWGKKLFDASNAGKLKGGVVWTEIDHAAGKVMDPEFVIKDFAHIGGSSF